MAVVNATMTDAIARATAQVYAKLAKTGGAVREQAVAGLEAAIS
jgi:hypothetical protein